MAFTRTVVGLICVALLQDAWAQQTSVIVEPKSVIALEGQELELMCRGGTPLQYCEFDINNKKYNLNPKTPESDGISYFGEGLNKGNCGARIRSAKSDVHNGIIKCSLGIETQSAPISGEINVTVAVAPTEVPQLSFGYNQKGDFSEGDTIQTTCTVRNSRPPANITWYLGDDPITEGLSPVEILPGTRNLLTVRQNFTRSVKGSDDGKNLKCSYQHLATSPNQVTYTTHHISVLYPPERNRDTIQHYGYIPGKEGFIPWTVQANPKPTFTWEIDTLHLREGDVDSAGHYEALRPESKGPNKWLVQLRIDSVAMEDTEKQYILRARNTIGEAEYKFKISTSAEQQVMELGAGAIIGIVVAILVLLLVIFLLIFARATGRWCFAGGVSPSRHDPKESGKFLPKKIDSLSAEPEGGANVQFSRNPNESSDTESADLGPANKRKKHNFGLSYIFKKQKDKVWDDTEMAKNAAMEEPVKEVQKPVAKPDEKKGQDIVYAELDLKDVPPQNRPHVRPEEEKTEYAEIVYTVKPKDEDLK